MCGVAAFINNVYNCSDNNGAMSAKPAESVLVLGHVGHCMLVLCAVQG